MTIEKLIERFGAILIGRFPVCIPRINLVVYGFFWKNIFVIFLEEFDGLYRGLFVDAGSF